MKDETTKISKIRDEAIVISGISGRFPNADSTLELSEKLYNKVDMVTGNIYPDIKHPELPQYYGKINGITKFDSQFFRVTPKQAESFEPCGRILMEQAYSAIFDAGVNPETLRGTKLGVFIGFSQSDTSVSMYYNSVNCNSFIISGCSKAMLANRVSYWIDAKGPSFGLDVECASSMACLEIACERIMNGDCDAALVSGCSYNNKPVLSLNMKRAGLLCLDGKTKCFDENGDGYVRSEAVSVLFLQKAKDAKRIYSEICYVKGKYFSKPDSTFLPTHNHTSLQTFFEEFYSKININPDDVEYIEANAPGISTSDQSELEAISKVFGKNHPVKIGCVKSNLGNAESASGAVGIIKICLAYQRGELPANINLTKPLDIVAMNENNLQIITDNINFNRGYTAINNFSSHRANFHALLRCPYIRKETNRYSTEFPRLVLVSGRTKEGINKVFDTLEKNPIDPEQIALLNNIYKYDIPGHTGRGFAIFDTNKNDPIKTLSREFEFYSGTKRPVCFMYSGLGSQWAGMGAQLMQIPIFSTAIKKCQTALESKGLNLVDIITNRNYDISNNILYSLTGIAAIQIGLTDVLKAIGIVPDFIIGHSVGEIGCSYADESLTAEEAILASYYRGLVSAETEFIKGKMAAIGLGHKKISCPADIDIACHNSSMSTTISGPADAVDKFVENLQKRDIFAKTVKSSGIAFHSRYIADAGPKLLSMLRNVIKEPKTRSKKWLSTCYVPKDWDLKESQLASAEYFTRNLLTKVLFEEAAENIPDDAIIIEIAPYGLLQSILKKSHASCLNISLLRRNYDHNIKLLLESIGKLYQNGLNPQIEVLYPKVEFPVSTETQGLSHLVDWDHSIERDNYYYIKKTSKHTAMYAQFVLSIYDKEYSFIKKYIRNGDNILPESSVLVLVWKTLAMYKEVNYAELAVKFNDIKFHNDVLIRRSEVMKLCVSIQKVSKKFEVTLEDKIVVSGYINEMISKNNYYTNNEREFDYNQPYLNKNTVYKLLSMHGYNLGGKWQSIKALNFDKRIAAIEWSNDWNYLIDSVLQLNILSESEYIPSRIKFITSLNIDVNKHNKSIIYDKNGKEYLFADRLAELGETVCGGMFCKSIIFEKLPLQQTPIQLYTQKFVPHFCNYPVDVQTAININMQIVSENIPNEKIKIYFVQTENNTHILNVFKHTMLNMSMLNADLNVIELDDVVNVNFNIETTNVVICSDFRKSKLTKFNILDKLNKKTFVLLIEDKKERNLKCLEDNGFALITIFDVDDKDILLIRKTKKDSLDRYIIFTSMDHLKSELQNLHNNTIFILEKNELTNVTSCKDTIKKLIMNGITVSILDIDEALLLPLNTNVFLQNQVEKGLTVNILRNEQWGGYYQVPLKSHGAGCNAVPTVKRHNFDAFQLSKFSTNISDSNVVQVHFSGIAMKDCDDILNENEMLNFGLDYSGIDSRGKRIMGYVHGGSLASSIQTEPDLLWPVPKHWSLEDAATVPLPYVHAYYCLAIKYDLLRRSTVLITGGAGALGQALISICFSMECNVFATVGSERKKKLLKSLFPEIKENNIQLSITAEFADNIRSFTNGKNCDVVINCYNGQIRQAAIKCVAENGIFLDLSQDDMKENESFEFGYLKGCRNYVTIRLSSIFTEENNISNKKMLQVFLTEGIKRGIVKPITRVVYSMSDVSKAFKLMTTRRHIGRILINMKEDSSLVYKDLRLSLNTKKVYMVIWDGSEIGVELINRLIIRGAKNIIIQNAKPLDNSYFQEKYLKWKQSVKVICYDGNLNTANGSKLFIECGRNIGPIDGIFHISSYFKGNNDTDDLILSHLDYASREIHNLSYFVSVKLVPFEVLKEDAESDQRISEREKLGFPSLTLTCRLKEMGFNLKTMLKLLNVFEKSLNQNYNKIFFTDLEINTHNVDVLDLSKETKHIFENKIEALIDNIENEETEATEPIFSLKTLISELKSDEIGIDPNEDMALVLSGFLGNYKTLSKSIERLKISAYCLQITPDMGGSILDLAKNILKYIKMRFKLKSKFYIVAHSFGVNVALEMAALLEREGYNGTIFCLDSSPLALQHQIKSYLGDFNENELQNCIIENMYSLIAQDSPGDLIKDLNDCNNWTEKTSVFIKNIKYKVSHTHQYLKDLINAIYNRFILSMAYKPNLKLNSEIVLIKGLPDPKINILPDDYDLTQYTSKPVKVFNMTSDHMSLPNDPNISTIINGMLEPETVEIYDKKNLCEVYYG